MGKQTDAASLNDKRLQSFHEQLKQFCNKRSTFRNNIDVDRRHIAFRSAQTIDPARDAIASQHIAAMILQGLMNRVRCAFGRDLELALEGKYAELGYAKQTAASIWEEVVEVDLCARIIIRQTRPKHLVVTVYPDRSNEIDPNTVPRISHEEIWK